MGSVPTDKSDGEGTPNDGDTKTRRVRENDFSGDRTESSTFQIGMTPSYYRGVSTGLGT